MNGHRRTISPSQLGGRNGATGAVVGIIEPNFWNPVVNGLLLLREKLGKKTETKDRLVTPVFLLITLSTFAYFLSVGATIPILPRFVEGPLGGGNVAVGIVVGAFAIAAVVLRPYAGRLGDTRGRRILIVGGGLVVGVATLGLMVVDTLTPAILLRVLMGLGEAFFYVGVATVINDLAPDNRRGEALSLFSLALHGGLALGPVVGELTLEASDYSVVWALSAGLSIAAALLALRVPETRPKFAESSRRLIHPAGLGPGLALGAGIWGLAGFHSFVPLYALSVGLDGSRLVFVTFSVVVLGVRFFGAKIPDKLGHLRSARYALALDAIGLVTIGIWSAAPGLFVGTAIFALGHALLFPALMSVALAGAPAAERGSVVGTFTAFFDLSFGLGAVSLGAISSAFGYSGLFISAAGIAAAGMLLLSTNGGRELGGFGRERVEESCEPR
jgi:MFS family permease